MNTGGFYVTELQMFLFRGSSGTNLYHFYSEHSLGPSAKKALSAQLITETQWSHLH